MSKYPRMTYKHGGPHEIHGGKFDYCIVDDEEGEREALAAGWSLTTADALAPAPLAEPTDDVPPTRAELEAKARELRIGFDGRTTDAKLAAKIAAALKA